VIWKLAKLVLRFVTLCPVRHATTSTWTNGIDFLATNRLICVSFTFYSIIVLSCFDFFISKCLIVPSMSVEKVRPSKIQNSKKGHFSFGPLDTSILQQHARVVARALRHFRTVSSYYHALRAPALFLGSRTQTGNQQGQARSKKSQGSAEGVEAGCET
jgi:hypothetical protein